MTIRGLSILLLLAALAGPIAQAQAVDGPPALGPPSVYVPDLSRLVPQAGDRQSMSASLQILIMLTLLTLAPSIVLMLTCFARMLIVLVLLRQALGTQTLPPTQILVSLALFLTFLAMQPTWRTVKDSAVDPYFRGDLDQMTAIETAGGAVREFMLDQVEAAGNEQDVYMMQEYATGKPIPADAVLERGQIALSALAPAFLLSELKVAFLIGFRIYLPFLVIDMVIATILVAMGMMMLPPVLISLPFKLLLFVLADGWHLVGGSLMASVAG